MSAIANSNGEPVGLLGGSFDPVHVGHLQLARDALANLPIGTLHLIPAAQPWQKDVLTPVEHRVKMLELALGDELPYTRRRIRLDLSEVERGGPTYTIDTLRAARAAVGPKVPLVLILGADQFERLETWREWERLPELAHIAVARRGTTAATLPAPLQKFRSSRHLKYAADLVDAPAGNIVDLAMTPVEASATEIRRLLAMPDSSDAGARLATLVPPPVLAYIREHQLYAEPHGH